MHSVLSFLFFDVSAAVPVGVRFLLAPVGSPKSFSSFVFDVLLPDLLRAASFNGVLAP